ncbi:enoyl-CoA hydratase/isomerase family protein [Pseudomonas sp. NFX15]
MTYQTLIYETTPDHVATITINRPEALNAFTAQMRRDFADVWRRVREDDHVHSVVLRAAEGRAFSSGADVKVAQTENVLLSDNQWNATDPGESLGPRSNHVWKPVITAVHGICCAGAFYWLNESDIILCSEDAQFFDPHVSYGLVCSVEPVGQSYRLPLQEVLRIALLGNDERVSAQTALRIGLVSEVVATREQLWTRAHDLAAKIANKPPMAVQGTVKAIWESLDMGRRDALNMAFKSAQIGLTLPRTTEHLAAMKQERSYEIR